MTRKAREEGIWDRRGDDARETRVLPPPFVDYLEHQPRERFLREEVSRNFPARSEIALGVPRVMRNLYVMRRRKSERRSACISATVFHFNSRVKSHRNLSCSPGVRCPSLIRHSYIRTTAKRSTELLRRLALETGHEDSPRASAPALLASCLSPPLVQLGPS